LCHIKIIRALHVIRALGVDGWLRPHTLLLVMLPHVSPTSDEVMIPFATRKCAWTAYTHAEGKPEGRIQADSSDDQSIQQFDRLKPPCSLSHFLTTWRTHPACKRIKLRKYLRFAKCDTCVELREQSETTRDPGEKCVCVL
jgi:hypothetical protein